MSCRRGFVLGIFVWGLILAAPKLAEAQVVLYGPEGFYAAPVYPSPVPVVVGYGYAAPAPVAYGPFIAVYPPAAPIGHALIAPRNGLKVEYEFRNGLWYVEIDD